MGWGSEREIEKQTQYRSVLCVHVRMVELMAKIRSVAYAGEFFLRHAQAQKITFVRSNCRDAF